jgi:hypothetical protein
MEKRRAKFIALDVFKQPLLARKLKRGPLPEGLLEVIQIAAGETSDEKSDVSADQWQAAAQFYLQHVLISDTHNDYRQIGVNDDAPIEIIREHRRWLLKWLHPDRNKNKWESNLFLRVQEASAKLENKAHHASASPRQPPKRRIRHLKKRTLGRRQFSIFRTFKKWVLFAIVALGVYLGAEKLNLLDHGGILANLIQN